MSDLLRPLPPQYPWWWCSPVGKPRVVKEDEERQVRQKGFYVGALGQHVYPIGTLRGEARDAATRGLEASYRQTSAQVGRRP